MPPSVAQSRQGPVWPLGFVAVATPGTAVAIDSLVDSAGSHESGDATTAYADRACQFVFQALKTTTNSMANSTGNVFILLKGGTRGDNGLMILSLAPGTVQYFPNTQMEGNQLGLEQFVVDADNANDGVLVTAIIK